MKQTLVLQGRDEFHVPVFSLPRLLLSLSLLAWSGLAQPAIPEPPEDPILSFTTNRLVSPPLQREFAFPAAGVFVSADFHGARLSDIRQTGATSYTALVAPENFPINNSAWYAFKMWSTSNQTVQVTFTYQQGSHRYWPQISRDGDRWERLPASGAAADSRTPTFNLQLGPQPLFIAGQELFTSEDFDRWLEDCQRLPFVRARVLGRSALGKPIRLLEITEAGPAAERVLIVGRQHPPEVTGTLALRAFVQGLCADSGPAKAFRKRFSAVVVPLVNPDGVDAGHWRHNANGVDLNRDWGQFNQVETRIVRDELLRLQNTGPGAFRFGLDFHSTKHDVFYTTYTTAMTLQDDLSCQWLQRLQALVPDYRVAAEGNRLPPGAPTRACAWWMRQRLGIPALTYEVGDRTDRELLRKVAAAGATALMELLTPSEQLAQAGAVPRRPLTKFDRHIIDDHKQCYNLSCIPSSVEMVLKLVGRVPGSYYEQQNAWKNKADGSFHDFDGKTIEGLTFHQQFSLARNPDFPLAQLFETIHRELEAGRFVMVGLACAGGWHNWVIYDEDTDGDFLAVSKAGAKTIEDNHVRKTITQMHGTDIGTYELKR